MRMVLQVGAIVMILMANLVLRPRAGKQGPVPIWRFPWTTRSYFSPAGFWLQLVGWAILCGILLRTAIILVK